MTEDEITKLVDRRICDAFAKLAEVEGQELLKVLETKPGLTVLEDIRVRTAQWLKVWAVLSDDPAERAAAAASVARGEKVHAGLVKRAKQIAARKGRR